MFIGLLSFLHFCKRSALVSEIRVRDCEGLLVRLRIQIQSVRVDVQHVGLRLAEERAGREDFVNTLFRRR